MKMRKPRLREFMDKSLSPQPVNGGVAVQSPRSDF